MAADGNGEGVGAGSVVSYRSKQGHTVEPLYKGHSKERTPL